MPRSRPSRISDAVRAELFATIGKPDDGRVDRAISILIARYVELSSSPVAGNLPPQIIESLEEEKYDEEFP